MEYGQQTGQIGAIVSRQLADSGILGSYAGQDNSLAAHLATSTQAEADIAILDEVTFTAAEAARTPPKLDDDYDYEESVPEFTQERIPSATVEILRRQTAQATPLDSVAIHSEASAPRQTQNQGPPVPHRPDSSRAPASGTQQKAVTPLVDVDTSTTRREEKKSSWSGAKIIANGAKIAGISAAMLLFTILACVAWAVLNPSSEDNQAGLRNFVTGTSAQMLTAIAGSEGVARIRSAVCSSPLFTPPEIIVQESCKCAQPSSSLPDQHAGESVKVVDGIKAGEGQAKATGERPASKVVMKGQSSEPIKDSTRVPSGRDSAHKDNGDSKISAELEKALRGWETCKAEKATLDSQLTTMSRSLDSCRQEKSTVSTQLTAASRGWEGCKQDSSTLRQKLAAAQNATKAFEVS